MYKNILVPVDLNDKGFSDKAVAIAAYHAAHSGARLHLLNVLPGVHMPMVASYFPENAIKEMARDTRKQLSSFAKDNVPEDIGYDIHVSEGKPYKEILKTADSVNADLIVMPSHKRSRINKAVLGSVASKVVDQSPINVMVIKP